MELPIDTMLPEIVATVKANQQIFLTATPGAGKTTRLPPELLNAVSGKIAVLQPRRMAAVAACQRVCEENKWEVGKEAGYQVRFDSKVTKNTRLIFMTDALMLRRLIDDPELNEFDLIVIDEFHERNLNQDLILGTIFELQQLGRSIKLLIMSATLDLTELKQLLPESRWIDVPGKIFPLEIRHSQKALSQKTDQDFFERVAQSILAATRETKKDILVFLPGTGEIKKVKNLLEQKSFERVVFELHGSLPLSEQQSILKPHGEPRVILSTNVAEASVTVPGVNYVIDTGLSKIIKVNLNSGFAKLELGRIAKFNAKQRSGRAAREHSGVALRLWTSHEEITQPESLPAECERVDLSSALLLLAHLGVSDFETFSWLSAPPKALLKRSQDFLKSISALDQNTKLTEFGRELLALPLEPRWGALLLLGKKLKIAKLAAFAVAILQEGDNLISNREVHSNTECDLTLSLQNFIESRGRVSQNTQDLADQYLNLLGESQSPSERKLDEWEISKFAETLNVAILLSQSDRLCRRRGNADKALMVAGRGIKLAKESQVRESEFFVALKGIDFPGQSDTTVGIATGFTKAQVLEILKDEVKISETIIFDEAKGQFFAKRVRTFKDLEIDEPTLTQVRSEDLGDRFVDVLVERWDWIVQQNENLNHWMSRWNFLVNSNSSSEFKNQAAEFFTKTKIRELLEMAAFGKNKIETVINQDFVALLKNSISKDFLTNLEKEAPAQFMAPSGVAHRIIYEPNLSPYVEVRLQEMFGTTTTPLLGFGNTSLTFRLLAPNFRPVQTTSDIAGFWQRAYLEVKKELKSRYPKHSWPDDPLKAPAVAKGRRRK